ncbi:NAD-dependent epimerase/dehydratase family protein [Yoonia sp. R2331]|uniref:NAD-dependent epimerase/dehydratase family protein n=1 Tax=Yoonia sp. R2331 TaxID=3237238 RepID=UPI0034E4D4BF
MTYIYLGETMRILIVGGTGFLGAATATAAVNAGHDTTVLTRTGPVVTGATALVADRMALPDLQGQFDAVIDTCAYGPDHVAALHDALGSVGQYILVSSISAYDDLSQPNADEAAPASPATPQQIAAYPVREHGADAMAYGSAYGPLKRSCELRALDWVPGAALIRLGLIVGPGDKTDRFTWWLRRIDQGGQVPVPMDQKVQLIDVADAGRFLVHMAETGQGGVLNLTGEASALTDMLAKAVAVAGAKTVLAPRDIAEFAKAEVAFWTDLPMVVPPDGKAAGMLDVSTARARKAGLVTRPLAQTIADTLAWDRGRRDVPLTCGLSAAQEARILNG